MNEKDSFLNVDDERECINVHDDRCDMLQEDELFRENG